MLSPAPRARARGVLAAGVAAVVVGWLWSLAFPLNKPLWTSSYVLFTAGIGAVLLAGLSAALDRGARRGWAQPLLVFGANPLIAYAGSEIARRILHSSIKLRDAQARIGFDEWVTRRFDHAGLPPDAASLAWALIFLGAWWLALSRLSRRRLFVRV
jgi:predicted acyltransferase